MAASLQLESSGVTDLRQKFYELLLQFSTFPAAQNFFLVQIHGLPGTVIEENVEKQDIAELRLTGEAEHSMETVIKRFIDELEVDDDTAMRLYLGGYWSMEELMDAIPDDLRLVEGITPTMARTLDSKLKRYK